MARGDKLERKDFADDKIFDIGIDYAKSLDVAIDANKKWADSFAQIKRLALEYAEIEKGFKVSSGRKQFLEVKKQEVAITEQVAVALKEQERTEKNLITTIERKKIATESTSKALIAQRLELQRLNKAEKEEAILNSKTSTFLERITVLRRQAARSVQDLVAKQALGKRLSDQEQKELAESTVQFTRYDLAIKKARITTGQFQENVGNYPKLFNITLGAVRKLIPLLGAGLGLRAGLDFAKEARQLSIEAKGIEFAFERVENRTRAAEKAFQDIKASTRGLLADMDIKKSIVEFDNFGIAASEMDTLLEFVSVRAAQTGKSFDYLRDSLVEGLSKESKLRIDNLGISTAALNKELAKTPNFVEAVANIARREIAEAGNILDEAANSQQKWNADLKNFKLLVGDRAVAGFSNAMYSLGSNILRAITPTEKLSDAVREEQVELNILVQKITDVNIEEEERAKKIQQLNDKYPGFLKNLDAEKVSNEQIRDRLIEVNDGYIKKIALVDLNQDIDEKATESGKKLGAAFNAEEAARRLLIETIGLTQANRLLETKSLREASEEAIRNAGITEESIKINQKLEREGSKLFTRKQQDLLTVRSLLNASNRVEGQSNELKEEANALEEKRNRFLEKYKDILNDINDLKGAPEDDGGEEELSAEDIERLKKFAEAERQAAFNLRKFKKEQEIASLKEIEDAETESFEVRKQALEDRTGKELALNDLLLTEKLRGIKKGSQQELQIYAEYNAAKDAILKQFDQGDQNLEVDRLKTQARIRVQEQEKALQESLALENEFFAESLESYDSHGAAVEAHEKRVADIKKQYAVKALEDQIAAIETLLATEKLSAEKRAEYERQVAEIKKKLSDIVTAEFVGDAKEREVAEKEVADKIQDLNNELKDALVDIFNAILDNKVDAIDREIEKSDEKYERLLENENLSEEQRKAIEKKQEADRERLEKKKREEQRKQAILNKFISAFTIGLTTAQAVIAALAPPPTGLGPVAGIPLAALTAAVGAAQIAAVLARKIPEYLKGTDWHPGGPALVGEVRPEVIQEPGKKPYIVDKPTILDLPQGTKVTPSLDEYARLFRASILTGVAVDNKKLNDFQARREFDLNNKELVAEMKLTRKAIEKNKTNVFVSQSRPTDLNHEIFRFKQTNWNG